ncbi:MAG: BamA/TamA family outer membrane protein [Acidobacteria bacterium]|nr:BamA/TamA family outer membrane protein [Acidobacteriota bacterium]
MRRVVLLLLLTWLPMPAVAQPAGQIVADVRVETTDGAPVPDSVVALVETRVGEPLTMADVRDTIDHFVGLGRYDDVRVMTWPSGEVGVVVYWLLRPIEMITRVTIRGGGDLSSAASRGVVEERFGGEWPATRAPELAAAVQAFYRDRGYRGATVAPLLAPGSESGTAEVTLDVQAGARTNVGAVSIVGEATESPARIASRLRLQTGRPYGRPDLLNRLLEYEGRLREDGYYAATVRETTTFDDEAHVANVEVTVAPGPHVRLVYAGDAVPEARLDSLVTVRDERSVDEDLLEDASRNIEAFLRERGYRTAQAPYSRAEQGGELVLTFTVQRGPLHRVNAVSVSGNAAIGTGDIEPLLKLTRGDAFVDARVGAIAAAIEELYRVRGHEQVRVTPAIEVLPEAGGGDAVFRPVDTRFDIVEGPATVVSEVIFEGAAALPESEIRGVVSLSAGRPFYRPLLAADRDQLETLYRNRGYLTALVVPEVTLADDRSRARVTWTVREGEQSRVDRVLITGNARTSTDIIARELRIGPGDPLGADAMAESQRRLSQLGLFRRVRIIDLPRTGSAERDVLVTVEESPSTAITYGGGLEVGRRLRQTTGSTDERLEVAPRGFFDISRRNLWGKNRTINFFSRVSLRPLDPGVDDIDAGQEGGYGFNDYRVTGTFREPRAFGTQGDAQITAFLEQGPRTSFTFRRRGVRADYARRFGQGFTITGRYTADTTRLTRQQIDPEDRLLIDRLFPQVRLSTFSGAVLRDSRDDVLEPQRGTVLGADASVAARAYGSQVGFSKLFLQAFGYRRLPGHGFVLAAGVRTGFADGFPREVPRLDADGQPVPDADGQPIVDIVEDLPASERFFAGGDTTVRGFAIDRLGTNDTLDQSGFPQGGNGLLVLNAELRSPYWKGLGLVGFVDAGNIFRRAGDITLGDLRTATGFGLRYRSPIGPLRVDLGFKINPRVLASGSRERGSVLHISLGQAF